MADEGGGSVVAAEALRLRATQQRARWEAFRRREREREERAAAGGAYHGRGGVTGANIREAPWRHPDAQGDGGRSAVVSAPREAFVNEVHAAAARLALARARARSAVDAAGEGNALDLLPNNTRRMRTEVARGATVGDADDADDVVAADVEEDESPQCRICFAGEEAGRLFSPCQCRGSIGAVHVACLNAWRNVSRNTRSYASCDQCGYRYRVERAEWASKLEHPHLAVLLAVVSVAAAVVAAGLTSRVVSARVLAAACRVTARRLRRWPDRWGGGLSIVARPAGWLERLAAPRPTHGWRANVSLSGAGGTKGSGLRSLVSGAGEAISRQLMKRTSPLYPEFAFYRAVRWVPPWWNPAGPAWVISRAWLADVLDAVVAGIVLVGLGAFGRHVVKKLRHDFRFNAEHLLFPMATMFASHGPQALRLVAAGGLIYAYVTMHEAVRLWSRDLLMRFGERVLEVQPPSAGTQRQR